MKKQEDFYDGYYIGITTHDGNSLHSAKVVCDMANFLNKTGGINFLVIIVFLHSRSKYGGDREWVHPFCPHMEITRI